MTNLLQVNKKSIAAWCFYDWANTAFSTVIITFIFGVYFSREIAVDETTGGSQWSLAIALSGLIIAVMAPLLGAMADHGVSKKKGVFFFSMVCIVASSMLWFAVPDYSEGKILFVLGMVIIANIGLELGQVFYNALLPEIAPYKMTGRLSGWAWGLGYIGGLTALGILLLFFIGLGDIKPIISLPSDNFQNIRIAGPFIGAWFFISMLPFLIFTKEVKRTSIGTKNAIKEGLKDLVSNFKKLKKYRNIVRFLIASAIYRDGLVTLFAVGGIFAADQFGMSFTQILIFAIGLNVTAGIGAIGFSFMDDYIGSKKTIILSILGLIFLGSAIFFIQDKMSFIYLSLGLGIFIGPVQAASRTMITKICPKDIIAQSYGFYALTGKSISFLGPLFYGLSTHIFETQLAGMGSIIIFWIIGLLILVGVKEIVETA